MAPQRKPRRPGLAPDRPPMVCRVPFDYAGRGYDRGQLIELQGFTHDERLIRLGYVAELEKGVELYECSVCGGTFVGVRERTHHGDRRHAPPRERTPMDEDAAAEAEERMLDQVAPLYLEKTAASTR